MNQTFLFSRQQIFQCKYVISKKYREKYKNLDLVTSDFFQSVNDLNVSKVGPFFMTFEHHHFDQLMNMTCFLPLEGYEEDIVDNDLIFRSYFALNHLIKTRLINDIEKNLPRQVDALERYVKREEISVNSYFLVAWQKWQQSTYVDIMMKEQTL